MVAPAPSIRPTSQVLELLLVADVVLERAGDDPQTCGQGAHGQRLDTVFGDDGECLGDHALAGEWEAAFVAPLLGAGVARSGMLPLPDVPNLNDVLEIKQCLL
jgi:hypothetical protein